MLIINLSPYAKEYGDMISIIRAKCSVIDELLKRAESNEVNIIIDTIKRGELEQRKIEADGLTYSVLFAKNNYAYALSAESLVDMVRRAGDNPDICVNVSIPDDLSLGEFSGALIHELTVHTVQQIMANQELAKYIANLESLEEEFVPQWEQMNKPGSSCLLDSSYHHRQMLNQDKGLGKAYWDGINAFVVYCNRMIQESEGKDKGDAVVAAWERIKDDIIDQYEECLKHYNPDIKFGGYLKIKSPAVDWLKLVSDKAEIILKSGSVGAEVQSKLIGELNGIFEKGIAQVLSGEIKINEIIDDLILLEKQLKNITAITKNLKAVFVAARNNWAKTQKKVGEFLESSAIKKIWALEKVKIDDHWLIDTDVDRELNIYRSQNANVDVIPAATTNVINGLATLSQVLADRYLNQMSEHGMIRDYTVCPINFGNAHWACLIIKQNHDRRSAPEVYFFDSLGSGAEKKTLVQAALQGSGVYTNAVLHDISPQDDVAQTDGYTCGTWLIESVPIIIGALRTDNDPQEAVSLLDQETVTARHNLNIQSRPVVAHVKPWKSFSDDASSVTSYVSRKDWKKLMPYDEEPLDPNDTTNDTNLHAAIRTAEDAEDLREKLEALTVFDYSETNAQGYTPAELAEALGKENFLAVLEAHRKKSLLAKTTITTEVSSHINRDPSPDPDDGADGQIATAAGGELNQTSTSSLTSTTISSTSTQSIHSRMFEAIKEKQSQKNTLQSKEVESVSPALSEFHT